jgi:hypothetical protein
VQQELNSNTWCRQLQGKITTAVEVEEFVSLWIRLQGVHLDPSTEDTIVWKWMADGVYTTHSAYGAQFFGVVKWDHTKLIWRAHTENRYKLFTWILIQNKQLTADNLTIRGWPHPTSCPLCNGPPETGHHLCLLCPFAQMVWLQVSN